MEYYELLLRKLPTLKVAFVSFISGIVIATCAILIPVYNQVDHLNEPITLFETILLDLEQGYVDIVDTRNWLQC